MGSMRMISCERILLSGIGGWDQLRLNDNQREFFETIASVSCHDFFGTLLGLKLSCLKEGYPQVLVGLDLVKRLPISLHSMMMTGLMHMHLRLPYIRLSSCNSSLSRCSLKCFILLP